MNSWINSTIHKYKKCAGKNCDRAGTITLKVRYLNMSGLFCDYCAYDLVIQDLAVKADDDTK